MTTCLGKDSTFGLLCMSFVNIYQFVFVCMLPSILILRVGCGVCIGSGSLPSIFTPLDYFEELARLQNKIL